MDKCPTCKRPIKADHEGPVGPKRERLTVSIPVGEEGVLEDLLIQFVDRFKDAFGDMPGVGERHWKYIGLHHALYTLATAPNDILPRLLPSETGA